MNKNKNINGLAKTESQKGLSGVNGRVQSRWM